MQPCLLWHRQKAVISVEQAALLAIASAAEALSSCIEGAEGAEGPADEAAAESVAQRLLQLLLHLSAGSPSLTHSKERVQLLELLLMQSLAPALMRHLASTGGQAQVSWPCHATHFPTGTVFACVLWSCISKHRNACC